MLELINQLDGFDPRGNIKVLMATNRPDTLDPALMRPGRLDRKIEFGLPDHEVCFFYIFIRSIILHAVNLFFFLSVLFLDFNENFLLHKRIQYNSYQFKTINLLIGLM